MTECLLEWSTEWKTNFLLHLQLREKLKGIIKQERGGKKPLIAAPHKKYSMTDILWVRVVECVAELLYDFLTVWLAA